MNSMIEKRRFSLILIGCMFLLLIFSYPTFAAGPGTITYQGKVTTSGGTTPADGSYTMKFSLWNILSGGTEGTNQKWFETHTNIVSVSQGIFSVQLGSQTAFPARLFEDNPSLWLQVQVDVDKDGLEVAEIYTPRVPMSTAPYSFVSDSWSLTGNNGTDPATNFIGTKDNKALEVKVNNTRVMRIEPTAEAPNIINGFNGNSISMNTIKGATICGGGRSSYESVISDNYGTVGGGSYNTAGNKDGDSSNASYATVSGGQSNTASGSCSAVSGGYSNEATYDYSAIAGGFNNNANALYTFVGGGWNNGVSASSGYSAIVGGGANDISQTYSFIGGGSSNDISQSYSVIGGGSGNDIDQTYSFIGGGLNNVISTTYSVISGGDNNKIYGEHSFIGGGKINTVYQNSYGTVAGGWGNEIRGNYGFIGGGYGNYINTSSTHCVIAGGNDNLINENSTYSTISGGSVNEIYADYCSIGGGISNHISGNYATIPGGSSNDVSGTYSFAAGRKAHAVYDGSFVWADSTNADFSSTGTDQFLIRASGGVGIGTNDPEMNSQLHIKKSATGDGWSSYITHIENSYTAAGGSCLALKVSYTSNPATNNKFISFFKSDGSRIAYICGNGSGGVTYSTSAKDIAEYLPKRIIEELMQQGEIVGFFNNGVSKVTNGAMRTMVTTTAPAMLGNIPKPEDENKNIPVAYLGQVPVKVKGTVKAGDYILPSGLNDGTGIAVSPDKMHSKDITMVVGRALQSSDYEKIKLVDVQVGLPQDQLWSEMLTARDARIDSLEKDVASIKQMVEKLTNR